MMMEWGDYQRTLMVVIEHQWEFFARFRRSWRDFVGWVPVFSIDHVRSWKHDVWGCGQRMGGHHFMSLFTLSPSHIELPVASPLSLTRAHSLFFHHLIYLLHRVGHPAVFACYEWMRHEFQAWHTYSGIIPHSSLWYFPLGDHSITILRCHISPLVIFVLCFFFHHCLLDIIFVPPWVVVSHTSLHGGLSRFFPHSPYGQWFRDLILRGRLVIEDSCYIRIWGEFIHLAMYFMGDHSVASEYAKKKNVLFIIPFSIEHVYECASLLYWVYVLERVHMRAYLWVHLDVYFLQEYESPILFCERGEQPFL